MLADAAALEDIDVVRILTYFDKGPVTVGFNVVHEALLRIVPERMERIMGWMFSPSARVPSREAIWGYT